MVQIIVENFDEFAGLPKRAWQGHTHSLFRKILQETVEDFCMIPFASSRLWSKIF